MKEFNIINKYFAPLSTKVPGAFSLKDDAAIINFPTGKKLVVTSDSCVEGIHFFKDDKPNLIAKKALRSALSDLAAKGGKPMGYMLSLALPPHINSAWLQSFSSGLKEDQDEFDINLIGGDTSKSNYELTVSITVLGTVSDGLYVPRSGALPGDRIYVTGTIGDSYYGLQILNGKKFDIGEDHRNYLIDRYHVPKPRLAIGRAIGEFAHASIDISDGLVADLGHICESSHQSAMLKLDFVPLSPAIKKLVDNSNEVYEKVITGGCDYELLFTVAPGDSEHVAFLAKRYNVEITHIGHIAPASDDDLAGKNYVKVVTSDGSAIKLKKNGYEHSW